MKLGKVFVDFLNDELVTNGIFVSDESVQKFLDGEDLEVRMPEGLEVVLLRDKSGNGKRLFRGVRVAGVDYDDNAFIDFFLMVRLWGRKDFLGWNLFKLSSDLVGKGEENEGEISQ